jgi:beta-alanine degradation protein BauB
MVLETKIVIENNKVKISEVRITPGDKIPMHSHGRYLSYAMNDSKVRVTNGDGSTFEREFKKGNAVYSDGGVTHEIQNIGSTDVFNLDIELK